VQLFYVNVTIIAYSVVVIFFVCVCVQVSDGHSIKEKNEKKNSSLFKNGTGQVGQSFVDVPFGADDDKEEDEAGAGFLATSRPTTA